MIYDVLVCCIVRLVWLPRIGSYRIVQYSIVSSRIGDYSLVYSIVSLNTNTVHCSPSSYGIVLHRVA